MCRFAHVARLAMGLTTLALTTAYAGDAPPSPQTTFFHANALYKDGQFAEAAKEYERVRQSGFESGNLYFNLGNAYFKAGQKGRAILNYARARAFMPSDPDLQANLAYAESLTQAEPCTPAMWERIAFPLAQRMSTRRLLWLSSLLYTLTAVGFATYRLWPRRPRWVLYLSAVSAVAVAIASISVARQVYVVDWQRQAVVINSGDTPARFEPASNGTVHFVLKEGAAVRVLDIRQDWVQVGRCDDRRGWVEKRAIEDL
jgi:tetratricopeptide (TPR) repeat protein